MAGETDAERAIFFRVVAVAAPERDQTLATLCAGDVALAGRVREMVSRADEALTLDPSAQAAEATATEAAPAPAGGTHAWLGEGQQIGRYTLERAIARGGMGEVWIARQDRPSRRVALKLVRGDRVSESYLRRLAYEAEVLGRLRHPGIAQVYDAGVAEVAGERHPFVAMELVEGRGLDEHLVVHAELAVAERVRMLIAIAEAVHHAHQRGVVHRDLKPANVLVDTGGRVKVVDFGVSVASDAGLVRVFEFADASGVIGTVPYMAPEQASGEAASAATDVHALGLLLHEMLTGALPYDVRGVPVSAALRAIREARPRALPGESCGGLDDLVWVARRALKKEPGDRYGTAAELASDLRRVLDRRPIEARPATARYVAARFCQRRTALVAGIATSAALLIAGTVGVAVFATQAAVGRATAEESLSRFIEPMIAAANPELQRGRSVADLSASELIGLVGDSIEDEPFRYAASEARIRGQIGRLHLAFSSFDDAEAQLREALDLARLDPPPAGAHAELMLALAEVLYRTDRAEEAGVWAGEALGRMRAGGASAGDRAGALMQLANATKHEGQPAAALPIYEDALGVLDLGDGVPRVDGALRLRIEYNRALAMFDAGERDGALMLLQSVLEDRLALLGESSIDVAYTRAELARMYLIAARYAEAEPLYVRSIETLSERLDPTHWRLVQYIANLGTLLLRDDRASEALVRYEDALSRGARAVSPRMGDLLGIRLRRASALAELDRLPEACAALSAMAMDAEAGGFARLARLARDERVKLGCNDE
ncbi:MAG: serine/threonine-protein kinase [Planctomycetota bacterium]